MATKQEVIDRAGYDLGILQLGQALEAQNQARLLAGYNEVYEQLKTDGRATWASTANVPDDLAPHVIGLLTINGLKTFRVSEPRRREILTAYGEEGQKSLREIDRLITPHYVSQDEATDY